MKKLILITAVVVYAFLAVSLVADYSRESPAPTVSESTAFQTTSPTQRATSKKPYLVRDVDGVVAVSDNLTGKIIEKTETQTALLPTGDRERLKKGIEVKDKKELRSLLEDICS